MKLYYMIVAITLTLIIYTLIHTISNTPIVQTKTATHYLGNKLFIYCFGRIISEKLSFPYKTDPILGFPHTYNHNPQCNYKNFPTIKIDDHHIDILNRQLHERKPKNIFLQGYFQKYEYLKPYKNLIRNKWLIMDNYVKQDPNDIVIHVRQSNSSVYLPFDYYEKALSLTRYNKVYICTDIPEYPILKKFQKYNPIIRCPKNRYSQKEALIDFKFMMSFNKIIACQSTFSWWAAFLSDASEVYAPETNYGWGRPELGRVGIEEKRYKYIKCDRKQCNRFSNFT